MALLGPEYGSSDEENPALSGGVIQKTPTTPIVLAPDVSLDVWSHNLLPYNSSSNVQQDPMRLQMMLAKPTDTSLTYNVPYAELSRAAEGPANPFKTTKGNALKRKNVLTGYAEEAAISDATFKNQHRTFQSRGYAMEPNASGNLVGDLVAAQQYDGRDVVQRRTSNKKQKMEREGKGDPSIVDGIGSYKGPWAKRKDEAQYEDMEASGEELASDEEYENYAIVPERAQPMAKAATDYQDDLSNQETTEFNGSSLADYMGRSYMHAPRDIDIDLYKEAGSERSYIPKQLIHTWKHGTKPINAIRFIPSTAHLLLSASADAKIKIFDVYREQELLRTFNGHTKSVSDINFNPDGTQFLSASYDRFMKL